MDLLLNNFIVRSSCQCINDEIYDREDQYSDRCANHEKGNIRKSEKCKHLDDDIEGKADVHNRSNEGHEEHHYYLAFDC